MPNVSGTPPPSSMHQHNTQHKTVPQHNYIKNRDYPYNEDTNARNVASSASTIREGNTPTRDSIPVHDGTHLKVSILREKNTSTNLWPKTLYGNMQPNRTEKATQRGHRNQCRQWIFKRIRKTREKEQCKQGTSTYRRKTFFPNVPVPQQHLQNKPTTHMERLHRNPPTGAQTH